MLCFVLQARLFPLRTRPGTDATVLSSSLVVGWFKATDSARNALMGRIEQRCLMDILQKGCFAAIHTLYVVVFVSMKHFAHLSPPI